VMAGGQGTRLRPLTSNQPKPMLPVLGQPMMQHVLRLARDHGLTDVVATVQFLASVVRNFFGDGSDLGIDLSYVSEQLPLGTGGSVKNAEPLLADRFVVLSRDSLTDVDLTELYWTVKSTWRSTDSSSRVGSGWGRARRSTRIPSSRAPSTSGRTAGSRPGASCASTRCWAVAW